MLSPLSTSSPYSFVLNSLQMPWPGRQANNRDMPRLWESARKSATVLVGVKVGIEE